MSPVTRAPALSSPAPTHLDGGPLLPPGVWRLGLRYHGGLVPIVRVDEDCYVAEHRLVMGEEALEIMTEIEGKYARKPGEYLTLVSGDPSVSLSADRRADGIAREWQARLLRAEGRVGW
jgi:hypothetical protein